MASTTISSADRLADLGLTVELLARVLRRADAATDDCTALDPPIMAGLLRWGRTTRFLREELVEFGWGYDNPRNLARTIHPSGEFAVVVCTGDAGTGSPVGDAGPRNHRGFATAAAVTANGQLAFDFGPLVRANRGARAGGSSLRTWLLLFYPDDDHFRTEVSLPAAFEDGRITRWTERILLPVISRNRHAGARSLTAVTVSGTRD